MPRRSIRSVTVNPNVRCQRLYPTEDTRRTVADLQTIGIRLKREEAIHLARVLLAASQEWDEIDVTGYRLRRRARDGTYGITVTSRQDDVEEDAAAADME